MTEPPVAPLDAYATAKPDEPTWTVQGGDPLGGPLLRVWAHFARLQAGVVSEAVLDGVFMQMIKACNENVAENKEQADELLTRALHTERISWAMDSYRKGSDASTEISSENLSVDERLDLWDVRTRAASKLSEMVGELEWIKQALTEKKFVEAGGPEATFALNNITNLQRVLKTTYNLVQFRRERHYKDA